MGMTNLHELTRLAAAQHGVFTASQARRLGISDGLIRRRLRDGDWRIAHPGVLLIGGRVPNYATELFAATAARSCSVASHRAAARLYRWDGFESAPVEITVPRPRCERLAGVVVHRSLRLDPSDWTEVAGIRTTTWTRTLCDLGAVVDESRLERALDSAVRQGLALDHLRTEITRLDRPGPSGVAALKRVLAMPHRAHDIPATVLERLMRTLLTAHGLPPLEVEYELRSAAGRLVARFDAAFPSVKVGVEAHSDAWHYGPRRGEQDRRRDRLAAELGWERVYLSWHEVHDPAEAVASLLRICRGRAALTGVDPLTWRPLPAA
jgi:hypothetical protein